MLFKTLPNHLLKDIKCLYPFFNLLKDGILITDNHLKVLYVNPAFSCTTGYTEKEMIGQTPNKLRSGFHSENFYKSLWEDITKNEIWEGVIWNRKRSGSLYPEALSIQPLKNTKDEITNYIAIFSKLTHLKATETTQINLMYYDALTKLPNWFAFDEHFKRVVKIYKRNYYNLSIEPEYQDKIAVVFFDIKEFSNINDTYGYLVGDKLLGEIANQMNNCVRGADILARFSDDKFVALVTDVKSQDDINNYLDRILKIFSSPFEIDDLKINAEINAGISIYPTDDQDIEVLVGKAEKAMYNAKKREESHCFHV